MQKDYTHMIYVLDRSGSMAFTIDELRNQLKNDLEEQAKQPGKVTVTIRIFDGDQNTLVRLATPKEAISNLTAEKVFARGSTALLDAIGQEVVKSGLDLASLPEDQRPSKVLLAILTDGQENVSQEWTRERVAFILKEQQEKYNWVVTFFGANQDAVLTGGSYNISSQSSVTFNPGNVGSMMRLYNSKAVTYRSGGGSSVMSWDTNDRKEVE